MKLLALFFSLKGRIPRSTFWCSKITVLSLYGFGYRLLDWYLQNSFKEFTSWASFVEFAVIATVLWCMFAIYAKRWHDLDKSAAMSFTWFIPIVGTIWVFVQTGLFQGTNGPNQYGDNPLAAQEEQDKSPNNVAFGLLSNGSRIEAKGDLEAAAAIYNEVIAKYPNSDAAKDAAIALRVLNERRT